MINTTTTSATTTAPNPPADTRPNRLRGLSYLRNLSQNHILSRDQQQQHQHHHHTPAGSIPRDSRSGPANHPGQASSQPPSPTRPSGEASNSTGAALNRSISHEPASTTSGSASIYPGGVVAQAAGRLASRLTRISTAPATPTPTTGSVLPPTSTSTSHDGASSNSPPSPNRETTRTVPPNTESASRRWSMRRTRSSTAGPASLPTTTSMSTETVRPTATASNGTAAVTNTAQPTPEFLPSIRFSTFYDTRSNRPSLTFAPVARTLPSVNEVIRVGRYSERDSQPPIPGNVPSSTPVGFKSKVVSRRHCEFWYEQGQWYIKDVKSSSGTFLNHIRLSAPATESNAYRVNDGDIVQLGIDFKGGEEMIFRCVKMRLELNRGWQSKLNAFNMNTHKRLRVMTQSSDAGQSYSQDCSICLNSIAPCQSLFVAPCSHTWHYKCIRTLLSSPQYPIFICPNCRGATDLEADIEDVEEWEVPEDNVDDAEQPVGDTTSASIQATTDGASRDAPGLTPPVSATSRANSSTRLSTERPRSSIDRIRASSERTRRSVERQRSRVEAAAAVQAATVAQLNNEVAANVEHVDDDNDDDDIVMGNSSTLSPAARIAAAENVARSCNLAISALDQGESAPLHVTNPDGIGHTAPANATSAPVPIPGGLAHIRRTSSDGRRANGTRTPSPNSSRVASGGMPPGTIGVEGPITPRNDAGPWVFDGSGLRGGPGGVPPSSGDVANGNA